MLKPDGEMLFPDLKIPGTNNHGNLNCYCYVVVFIFSEISVKQTNCGTCEKNNPLSKKNMTQQPS